MLERKKKKKNYLDKLSIYEHRDISRRPGKATTDMQGQLKIISITIDRFFVRTKFRNEFKLICSFTFECLEKCFSHLCCTQCYQIWENFDTLAKKLNVPGYFKGLFNNWQNFEPSLVNLLSDSAIFHRWKWPNIGQIM